MSSERARNRKCRRRWLLAIIGPGYLLASFAPAGARSDRDARELLQEGMRVEVEGRLREEGVYEADVVKMKGDRRESLRIEGILEAINLPEGTLNVAGVILVVSDSTDVIDGEGKISALERLDKGMRVRTHVTMDSGEIRAEKIKVLKSKDRDTEITAPVERLVVHGRRRMEIIVLGERFQCDNYTAFFDPDGGRLYFGFTDLDIYSRLVDNDDERPAEQLGLGEILTVGGEFQLDLIPEENFDLYDEMDSDVLFSRISTRLELSSKPHPDVDLLLKVAGSEPVGPFDPFHPVRSDGKLRLAEANLIWRRVFTRRLGLEVGRQDFDEKREWLYDENLDGVRLYVDMDPVRTEVSISTYFSERTERDQGVINYILYTSYDMGHKRQFAAYIIHREDRDHPNTNFDRRWYGLRSFGAMGKSIDYWIELALMRGDKQGRTLDGRAFDIGFTHVLKGVLLEPSFTFGYAYASGDHDYRDNIDGNFRQTGFDDNNDKFNGVNSFKYYGEVFDPELSNMRIYTSGVGFRWARRGSVDILYHIYRQVVAKRNVHGGNFLVEPWGTFKALGDEIDILAGYEKLWNRIDLELIVGFFRPDYAYGPFHDTATRTKLEVEDNF